MTIFSASEFVDQVVKQYLCRLTSISPDDDVLRGEIIREIRCRLVALSSHLRTHAIEEAKLQRSVLQLLVAGNFGADKPSHVDYHCLAAITQTEKTWYRTMARRIEEMKQDLQDGKSRQRKDDDAVRTELGSRDDKIRDLQLESYSNRVQLQHMEEALKKQDVQLAVFIKEKRHLEPYVCIAKKDIVQALDAMKPYMTWYYLYKYKDDVPIEERFSNVLMEQLSLLLDQIDRYKRRIQETSKRVEMVEHDMEETMAMLGVEQAGNFQKLKLAIKTIMDEKNKQKDELAARVIRLSSQIAQLKKTRTSKAADQSIYRLQEANSHSTDSPCGGLSETSPPKVSETGSDVSAHTDHTGTQSDAKQASFKDRSAKLKAATPVALHAAVKSNSPKRTTGGSMLEAIKTHSGPSTSEEKKRLHKNKLPFGVASKK